MLQMTLKRALAAMLPNLDAQLVPYSNSRAGHSAHRPATAPSGSHPPCTPLDPHTQEANLLDEIANTASVQCQSEASSQPQQLPLATEFSLSSIDHSAFPLEARSQDHRTADSLVEMRHQFASDMHHQREAATPSNDLINNRQRSVTVQHQVPVDGLTGSHTDTARQQCLLEHRQQTDGQLQDSLVGSVRPSRVSVDTAAGSVRRTVITVAELQATVQPETASAQPAFQDDHITGRLMSSASASAPASPSHKKGEPDCLGPHAHPSRSQPGVSASQSHLLLQSDALQLSGSAAAPQQVAVSCFHVPDRTLQNSPALNSAHHRANSPVPEGKAHSHSSASQLTTARRSQDTDAVLQSRGAVQEAALLSAIQGVQHAPDAHATAALQALRLQVCSAAADAMQTCLPQVCSSVHVCIHTPL